MTYKDLVFLSIRRVWRVQFDSGQGSWFLWSFWGKSGKNSSKSGKIRGFLPPNSTVCGNLYPKLSPKRIAPLGICTKLIVTLYNVRLR